MDEGVDYANRKAKTSNLFSYMLGNYIQYSDRNSGIAYGSDRSHHRNYRWYLWILRWSVIKSLGKRMTLT